MTNIFNPLDLHGPAFLAYYAAIATFVVGLMVAWQRIGESAETATGPLSDPYLIAALRGGEEESARVAVATLIDRGLVASEDNWLSATPRAAGAPVRAPLEKALLAYLTEAAPGRLQGAVQEPRVRRELRRLEDTLLAQGLLLTPSQHLRRAAALGLAVGVLWMITALQIANRHPAYGVGFLLVLTLVFTAVAAHFTFRRRTPAGDRVISDVRQLLEASRVAHARTLGSKAVPALVLAAFGLSLLPGTVWGRAAKILPNRHKSKSDGSSGSDSAYGCGGSSCGGGGSSDGGGGSCGGGGGCGGGGCGGCGG